MRYLIAVCFVAAFASRAQSQTAITPPRIERLGPGEAVPLDASSTTETSFLSGTGIGVWPGGNARVNIDSRAFRIGVLGRPTCEGEGAQRRCISNVVWEVAIDTYIVDALGDPLTSVKDYVLSGRGSPVSIRVPFKFGGKSLLAFNTLTDTVPQSWAAGEPLFTVRGIPVKDESDKLRINGSVALGYMFEGHLAFLADNAPGTIFVTLTPTYHLLVGETLQGALDVDSRAREHVGAIEWGFGWQFGGASANNLRVGGTFAFNDIAGSRSQLTVAFAQALRALGASQ